MPTAAIPLASIAEQAAPASEQGAAGKAPPEVGSSPRPAADPGAPGPQLQRGMRLFEQARQADAQDDPIKARQLYNQARVLGLPEMEARQARDRLVELADQTLFSSRRFSGDPLVANYIVQPGDVLAKIAGSNHLTAELLAHINELTNVHKIRAGQNLKVLEGPFRVEIRKNAMDMQVYLQDTLVRYYSVGLGEDASTPTGEWLIKNKLMNPTYYPPRGGGIIAADDPQNPLGERWLGLQGVQGEAVGQLRYGIHGTNDPSTIGKSVSMGCVRMHNADVEWLYNLLVVQDSSVLITD